MGLASLFSEPELGCTGCMDLEDWGGWIGGLEESDLLFRPSELLAAEEAEPTRVALAPAPPVVLAPAPPPPAAYTAPVAIARQAAVRRPRAAPAHGERTTRRPEEGRGDWAGCASRTVRGSREVASPALLVSRPLPLTRADASLHPPPCAPPPQAPSRRGR